jgi:(p)ppGpp synthase/HD superfamily hydrolase
MRQALEAALGACEGVLPAKGAGSGEVHEPAFVMSTRLTEALAMAIERHRHEARTGTTIPSMTHLLAVSALVGESGGSEDEMIAALLHDAVEEGGGTALLDEIERRFGGPVAEIVAGCTETLPGNGKAPWLARKQAFLTRLAEAPLTVLRVTCADKLHNAQAIARDLKAQGPSTFVRFKGDRDGTLWYYRSLARLFGALVQDEPGLDPGFRAVIRELRETVAGFEG